MKTFRTLMLATSLVNTTLAMTSPTRGATAQATQIFDNRLTNLENPGQHGFAYLVLSLRLSSDDVKSPSKCGDWKLESATDDLGTNLVDPGQASYRATLTDIPAFAVDKTDGSFIMNLLLAQPPRKATKIATLKGTVTVLAGGTAKEIKAGSPLKLGGTKLDDRALKEAGLEIVAKPVVNLGAAVPVAFEVSGNTDALGKITVVTTDGKPAPGNPSWNTDPRTKKMNYTYFVASKLDDSMSVVVTVMVGQKKVVVPLDLKDVELP